MKNTMKAVLIMGLLLVIGTTPALGQESEALVPYQRVLMVCFDPARNDFPPYGDICSWAPGETELRRETTSRSFGELAISPDGSKVVYLALPDDYIAALLRGEDPTGATQLATVGTEESPANTYGAAVAIGRFPTNIGILDLTRSPSDPERFITAADQTVPENADLPFLKRALPVWSPDSSRIAWIEEDLNTRGVYDGRIMVYDTHTGTTQNVANVGLGWADGGDGYRIVGWGSMIAHSVTNAGVYPDLPNGGFGSVLSVYTLTGYSSSMPISYFANFEDRLTAVRWVLHRDQWRLALHYPNLGWLVLDPLHNLYEHLENPPFLQAVTGVGWAGHFVDTTAYPLQLEWRSNAGRSDDFTREVPLTFDPQGNPVWLDDDGQLVAPGQGSLQPFLPPGDDELTIHSAVWAPFVWRTDGLGTAIESAMFP